MGRARSSWGQARNNGSVEELELRRGTADAADPIFPKSLCREGQKALPSLSTSFFSSPRRSSNPRRGPDVALRRAPGSARAETPRKPQKREQTQLLGETQRRRKAVAQDPRRPHPAAKACGLGSIRGFLGMRNAHVPRAVLLPAMPLVLQEKKKKYRLRPSHAVPLPPHPTAPGGARLAATGGCRGVCAHHGSPPAGPHA